MPSTPNLYPQTCIHAQYITDTYTLPYITINIHSCLLSFAVEMQQLYPLYEEEQINFMSYFSSPKKTDTFFVLLTVKMKYFYSPFNEITSPLLAKEHPFQPSSQLISMFIWAPKVGGTILDPTSSFQELYMVHQSTFLDQS